jgi:Holliday junction resolvase
MSLRDLSGVKPKPNRYSRTLTSKEVKRIKKRGYDAERELVKKLRNEGFDALRIPVSAPSKEPFPDVFAVRDDTILAFEVKSQQRYAYYKRNQVLKLHEFLKIHRYYPKRLAVLAAKFKYKGWTFLIAEKPDFFSLRIGQGLTLSELIKKLGSINHYK